MEVRWLIFLLGLGLAVTGRAQTTTPDLAKLRAAAEAGDAKAQEALGSHFASAAQANPESRIADLRESARWSSRAAYAGIYTAQLRIAQFYRKGEVLPKDLISAYLWMRAGINRSPYAIIYQGSFDQLRSEMTPAQRDEAEERLRKFQIKPVAGLNPVEADLAFAQLHLDASPRVHGVPQAVINGVSFASGETKELKLDGETIRLNCFSVDAQSVLVSIAGTSYIHWLKR